MEWATHHGHLSRQRPCPLLAREELRVIKLSRGVKRTQTVGGAAKGGRPRPGRSLRPTHVGRSSHCPPLASGLCSEASSSEREPVPQEVATVPTILGQHMTSGVTCSFKSPCDKSVSLGESGTASSAPSHARSRPGTKTSSGSYWPTGSVNLDTPVPVRAAVGHGSEGHPVQTAGHSLHPGPLGLVEPE